MSKKPIAKIQIEYGHTLKEWRAVSDDECWDFPFTEMFDGTLEPQEDMVYYLINGRLYETTIHIDN